MTLNAFAKLHWLTTVDIMWLKAAHAFSQPLFCGPTGTDQVAEGGAMNEQEDRKRELYLTALLQLHVV